MIVNRRFPQRKQRPKESRVGKGANARFHSHCSRSRTKKRDDGSRETVIQTTRFGRLEACYSALRIVILPSIRRTCSFRPRHTASGRETVRLSGYVEEEFWNTRRESKPTAHGIPVGVRNPNLVTLIVVDDLKVTVQRRPNEQFRRKSMHCTANANNGGISPNISTLHARAACDFQVTPGSHFRALHRSRGKNRNTFFFCLDCYLPKFSFVTSRVLKSSFSIRKVHEREFMKGSSDFHQRIFASQSKSFRSLSCGLLFFISMKFHTNNNNNCEV